MYILNFRIESCISEVTYIILCQLNLFAFGPVGNMAKLPQFLL